MKVTSNNADIVSGNTYTWTITKENYDNKSISLAMQSINEYEQEKEEEEQKQEEIKGAVDKKNSSYTMYIFCGVLLVLILIGYAIFNKIKNKNNNFDIDD